MSKYENFIKRLYEEYTIKHINYDELDIKELNTINEKESYSLSKIVSRIFTNDLQKKTQNVLIRRCLFKDMKCSESDFTAGIFINCHFHEVEFQNVNFKETIFINCFLEATSFKACKFQEAYFINTQFKNTNFVRGDIIKTKFINSNYDDIALSHNKDDINKATIKELDIEKVDLTSFITITAEEDNNNIKNVNQEQNQTHKEDLKEKTMLGFDRNNTKKEKKEEIKETVIQEVKKIQEEEILNFENKTFDTLPENFTFKGKFFHNCTFNNIMISDDLDITTIFNKCIFNNVIFDGNLSFMKFSQCTFNNYQFNKQIAHIFFELCHFNFDESFPLRANFHYCIFESCIENDNVLLKKIRNLSKKPYFIITDDSDIVNYDEYKQSLENMHKKGLEEGKLQGIHEGQKNAIEKQIETTAPDIQEFIELIEKQNTFISKLMSTYLKPEVKEVYREPTEEEKAQIACDFYNHLSIEDKLSFMQSTDKILEKYTNKDKSVI